MTHTERQQVIQKLITKGCTMKEIGRAIGGVSRQRVYQLLTKYNIPILNRKNHGFWKQQPIQAKWLWKIICSKKLEKHIKWELFQYLSSKFPTHCPIFNLELDYSNGTKTRRDNSPSIDRIDSFKPYSVTNVHIISWRANRIKNDGTSEEHRRIADYLLSQ